MTEAYPMTLRDRLHALRRSALARLSEGNQFDGGMLRLVADAGAVLAALDAEAAEAVAPVPGDRAVVDDDNVTVRLVVYSADKQAVCATLSPIVAIRLGNQLIGAGVRRL